VESLEAAEVNQAAHLSASIPEMRITELETAVRRGRPSGSKSRKKKKRRPSKSSTRAAAPGTAAEKSASGSVSAAGNSIIPSEAEAANFDAVAAEVGADVPGAGDPVEDGGASLPCPVFTAEQAAGWVGFAEAIAVGSAGEEWKLSTLEKEILAPQVAAVANKHCPSWFAESAYKEEIFLALTVAGIVGARSKTVEGFMQWAMLKLAGSAGGSMTPESTESRAT
jgi:hypothetical protein